jgi:uncharacterized protein YndB with AHSA1/START domain
LRAANGDGHWVHGEFQEISPHDFLAMTWTWEGGDLAGHEMLVSVSFTAVGEATEVRLVHSRLPSEGAVAAHRDGWSSSFECLDEAVS